MHLIGGDQVIRSCPRFERGRESQYLAFSSSLVGDWLCLSTMLMEITNMESALKCGQLEKMANVYHNLPFGCPTPIVFFPYLHTHFLNFFPQTYCDCYIAKKYTHQLSIPKYQLLYPESSPESLGSIHSSSWFIWSHYSITHGLD